MRPFYALMARNLHINLGVYVYTVLKQVLALQTKRVKSLFLIQV
jgi:hypothetical protein